MDVNRQSNLAVSGIRTRRRARNVRHGVKTEETAKQSDRPNWGSNAFKAGDMSDPECALLKRFNTFIGL